MGSTPERLYYRKGNQLFTEALAGTVAVSDNPIETEKNAQWLLKDTKNIYENTPTETTATGSTQRVSG